MSKDTGVTINEQTCEERGEASTTGHALSRVVAEQDSPNGNTDDATDESVVRPVKKEASKKESQPIVSKENVSKSTSSSASKDVTVKHKPYEVCLHHIASFRIMKKKISAQVTNTSLTISQTQVAGPVSDTVAAASCSLSDLDSDIHGDSVARIGSSLQVNKDDDKVISTTMI